MPKGRRASLRARLERDGPLAIDEAIRVVTAVAAALEHAHRQGIVHRDVKPENILLSDGVPVVADFGIATLVTERHRAVAATGAGLTQLATSLGTPAYMSPEQALGETDVDGRTDVYALGVLLYELLAGTLPFTGRTAHAIIAQHLATLVPSLRGGWRGWTRWSRAAAASCSSAARPASARRGSWRPCSSRRDGAATSAPWANATRWRAVRRTCPSSSS